MTTHAPPLGTVSQDQVIAAIIIALGYTPINRIVMGSLTPTGDGRAILGAPLAAAPLDAGQSPLAVMTRLASYMTTGCRCVGCAVPAGACTAAARAAGAGAHRNLVNLSGQTRQLPPGHIGRHTMMTIASSTPHPDSKESLFRLDRAQFDKWITVIRAGEANLDGQPVGYLTSDDEIEDFDPNDAGEWDSTDPLDNLMADLKQVGVLLPPVGFPDAFIAASTDSEGYRQVQVNLRIAAPYLGGHHEKCWLWVERGLTGGARMWAAAETTVREANQILVAARALAQTLVGLGCS